MGSRILHELSQELTILLERGLRQDDGRGIPVLFCHPLDPFDGQHDPGEGTFGILYMSRMVPDQSLRQNAIDSGSSPDVALRPRLSRPPLWVRARYVFLVAGGDVETQLVALASALRTLHDQQYVPVPVEDDPARELDRNAESLLARNIQVPEGESESMDGLLCPLRLVDSTEGWRELGLPEHRLTLAFEVLCPIASSPMEPVDRIQERGLSNRGEGAVIARPQEPSVVSGPPLSVGRLRQNSARDPHLHWRGAGLTACIGSFDLEGRAADAGPGGRAAVPRVLRESPGEEAGSSRSPRTARSRTTLAGFFETGGRELVVLDDARTAAIGRWIGEDGGPGKRTGVFQLLDLQDVSTVAVLVSDAHVRDRVLAAARRRPDKLFLFPALSRRTDAEVRASKESVEFLLPNAVEVHPFVEGAGLLEGTGRGDDAVRARSGAAVRASEVDERRDLGRLLALLDRTEFSDQPRFESRPHAASRWPECSPGILRLMAWRRWEGLRRSIELGSRWTVMELHHPLVWRRLEREVRGFLHRMAEYGLIQGPGRGGFEVRCAPRGVSPGSRDAPVPAVDLHVSVRLTPPYDRSTPPATMSPATMSLRGVEPEESMVEDSSSIFEEAPLERESIENEKNAMPSGRPMPFRREEPS